MAVSSIVLENGGTEDEAIAALLHDGPEDQGGLKTLEQIRAMFGDDVATIVERCSDSLVDDDEEEKAPWPERKAAYIEHLTQCADPSVYIVSAADKLHNLRSIARDFTLIGNAIWKRFRAGREDTLKYYRNLAYAYCSGPEDRRRKPIVDEIVSLIDELERVQEHSENSRITYGFAFKSEPFDSEALKPMRRE